MSALANEALGDLESGNPRLLPQDFVDRMWDERTPASRAASLKLYRSVNNPDAMGRSQAAVLKKRKRPALVIWGADHALAALVSSWRS